MILEGRFPGQAMKKKCAGKGGLLLNRRFPPGKEVVQSRAAAFHGLTETSSRHWPKVARLFRRERKGNVLEEIERAESLARRPASGEPRETQNRWRTWGCQPDFCGDEGQDDGLKGERKIGALLQSVAETSGGTGNH